MLQPNVALKIVVANRLMQHHLNFEEQRRRSGESTRLSLMWPGFKSRRRHHMLVEFVVGSLLCSERFFCGYSGCPLSSKTNISKFQFDKESGKRRTTLWMCYLQIVSIYSFIYNCSIRDPIEENIINLWRIQ